MNYESTIEDFIVENFLFGDGENLEHNTSFLASGIIDSTGILELITYLENSFGIKVEDDELIPENLDSINNVSQFLKRKVNGAAIKNA